MQNGFCKFQIFLVSMLCSALLACSTFPGGSRKFILKSSPSGADVIGANGETLGRTPLVLEGSRLIKVQEGNQASVTLRKEGYAPLKAIFAPSVGEEISLNLTPLSETYFRDHVLSDFKTQTNDMVREVLSIQGLLIAKRWSQAEQRISAFQTQYPLLAASYVLSANIALAKNEKENARQLLLRARQLDPSDEVVTRMLANLRTRGNDAGGAE